MFSVSRLAFFFIGVPFLISAPAAGGEDRKPVYLSPRNLEAPFCYRVGGVREWPIFEECPDDSVSVFFRIEDSSENGTRDRSLAYQGLRVSLSSKNLLRVDATGSRSDPSFRLKVLLRAPHAATEEQTLEIRPAPPPRPVSYLADFGDDIIRIFLDSSSGAFRPVTKNAFDQYFRRLQAHGVERLIVWLGPHPYITDPDSYSPEDWSLFEAQARAIVESSTLEEVFSAYRRNLPESQRGGYTPYAWIRRLLALRLMRSFGEILSQSAIDHDIRLTLSFRPFEAALTKYYEIPAFDRDGRFLWGFLPMGSPTLNFHPDRLGFAHYRTVLRQVTGGEPMADLREIQVPEAKNTEKFLRRFRAKGDNLAIVASPYPPIREDSFVLQKTARGRFSLRRFGRIRQDADSHRLVVRDFRVETDSDGSVRITGLDIPDEYRYLLLWNPSRSEAALGLSLTQPVVLRSRAGNRLGRENVYWVFDSPPNLAQSTRIAGIPDSGAQHTEFNATELAWKHLSEKGLSHQPILDATLVIDRGPSWAVEMMDLDREPARQNVLNEIRAILEYPAFDEILINTRSHTQLPGYLGDGDLGIVPIHRYRKRNQGYRHLGIDLAYAPLRVAEASPLVRLVRKGSVEKIACWQEGEWRGECLDSQSPHVWRYSRNRAIATGIRKLLIDLNREFPGTRIRMVIPPGKSAIDEIREKLKTLTAPNGQPYGVDYYRRLSSSINFIRSIGEGTTLVDLSGLQVEPVLFGIRNLVDPAPLALFTDASLRDFRSRSDIACTGPYSLFFEAQASLRSSDPATTDRRQEILCFFLSRTEDIQEVILYEAADWLYFLPLSKPSVCGYSFLDACLSAE